MSSTRRANKRARLARRAENDAMRTARRDSLAVLLSRAQRGAPLTPDEAALLRAAVEAEIREGDDARTSERGQQRAMEQQRQRVEAAEAAIVEAEQRAEAAEHMVGILDAVDEGRAHGARRIMNERDEWQQRAEQAEERLARIRDMADGWKRRLPATIRTATAADAVRYAADGDDRPVMFAVTNEQQSDAEERAERAATRTEGYRHRAEQAEAALDRVRALAADMRTWCSPHGIATQYADDIERALNGERAPESAQQIPHLTVSPGVAVIHDRSAERAEATIDEQRAMIIRQRDALNVAERHAEQAEESLRAAYQCSNDAERARAEAEQRTEQAAIERAQWKAIAVRRRHRAEEAIRRADRFETAWHSARDRARKHARRADLADAVTAETKRLLERRTTTLRERAQRAEAALDRARAVGPQLEYDATAPGMAEAAREAFRDSSRRIRAALTGPEVITDRATIRNTLAEPEPTECEVSWHVHVETRPGPECRRSNTDTEA